MSEGRNIFKRILWGITIAFALYLFTLFFWIQGNSLIFNESHFTIIGFIVFIILATNEFNINLIGVWPKEKKPGETK